MSFQDIAKIETADTMIDIAFRAGREKSEAIKLRHPKKLMTTGEKKTAEIEVIKTVTKVLSNSFDRTLNSFPDYETMNPFYKELLECTVEIPEYRKSLGALAWAKRNVERFGFNYTRKLHGMRNELLIVQQRKVVYGRISSIVKQVKDELIYLESVRNAIRQFPVIKENMTTVAIFGFPNVGKSTLLSKLTASRPEIAPYAFTTKTLNLGYIKMGLKKLQLLDTPGTLNRFDKMNDIERQAYLALKMVADRIVYVFDLTEASYPVEDQLKLFKSLKIFNKPIIIYFSKSDLLNGDEIERFLDEHKDLEELGMESWHKSADTILESFEKLTLKLSKEKN